MHILSLAILFVAIVFAYGISLTYDFVWDDHYLIEQNAQVRQPGQWHRLFYTSFWEVGESRDDVNRSFYRPLVMLSYVTDHARGGVEPRTYHLTNLLWHAACSAVVYGLGVLLFGSVLPAFATAFLFAVHPVRVENVCWISGRTDVLCGFFFLSAVALFVYWTRQDKGSGWWVGALLLYVLALLSKEMALSLPIILVCIYAGLDRERHPWKALVRPLAAFLIVTVAYIALRDAVLGKVAGPALYGDAIDRLISVPMVFVRYVGLLCLVVPADPHHSEGLLARGADMQVWLYALMMLGYIILVAWLFRVRHAAAPWAAWLFVTLLPVFRLGAFGDVLYADRFLYIPSVGFAIMVVMAARHLVQRDATTDRQRTICGLFGVFTAAGLLLIVVLNRGHWVNDVALFSRAAQTSPDSAYVRANLALSYERAGRNLEAIAEYKKAIELEPEHYIAYFNLANVYKRTGAWTLAQHYYKESLARHETAQAHNNLGESYRQTGNRMGAYRHFLKSSKLKPSYINLTNLGRHFLHLSNPPAALRFFEDALKHDMTAATPEHRAMVHCSFAAALAGVGNVPDARHHAALARNAVGGNDTYLEEIRILEAVIDRVAAGAEGVAQSTDEERTAPLTSENSAPK